MFDKLRKTKNRSITSSQPFDSLNERPSACNEQECTCSVYIGDMDTNMVNTTTETSEGKYQLVFVSPEALLTDLHWRDTLMSPVVSGEPCGLCCG